mgnify:CR=1 FL=1
MVRKSFGLVRSGLNWLENKLVLIESRARAQRKDFVGIFALTAMIAAPIIATCIGTYIFFTAIGGILHLVVYAITEETEVILVLLIIFCAWRLWQSPDPPPEPEPPKTPERHEPVYEEPKKTEITVTEVSVDGITSSF